MLFAHAGEAKKWDLPARGPASATSVRRTVSGNCTASCRTKRLLASNFTMAHDTEANRFAATLLMPRERIVMNIAQLVLA